MIKAWKKIKKIESGCWEWQGSRNTNGYGRLERNNKRWLAHRFFYEHFKGKIPLGLGLDHLCRNRICVNPDHLEPVTQRVNIIRGNGVAGINIRKTHCKYGHEFKGKNVWFRWSKKRNTWWRECLVCRNKSTKAWRLRVGYHGSDKPYQRSTGFC